MNNGAKQTRRRRRRRGMPTGVPTALVVLLLVIGIVMGGLMGFVIARNTSPIDDRVQKANERIIELENILTLIGYTEDDDPEAFTFDDTAAAANPAEDLAGVALAEEDDTVWSENETLLAGTLPENGDPVVVAEFDGGQLMSSEVVPVFNDQLTTQIFAGYSADEVSDSVLQSVLADLTAKKLVELKAHELGLDQLTAEEEAAVQAQAQADYKDQIAYYTAFVDKAGKTPAQIDADAEQYMREDAHISVEGLAAAIRSELPEKKYREYVCKDITVSDAEVQAHYQERLDEQKAAFTEYSEEFEFAHTDGQTILYNLDGYRAVRNLLLPFDSDEDADKAAELFEQLERLDPMADADQIRAIDAQLDPMFAPLESRAAELAEKLKNGARFSDLLNEYGGDELMENEPLRSQGYYISDHTFLFSVEFVEGSMILDSPGQVSAPLRSPQGLHLVEYLRNVTPGEVPLDQVMDAMRAEALTEVQDEYYEAHVERLLEQADVRYYPERLQ